MRGRDPRASRARSPAGAPGPDRRGRPRRHAPRRSTLPDDRHLGDLLRAPAPPGRARGAAGTSGRSVITPSGVTTTSTAMSWGRISIASGRICTGWTVVTIGVRGPTRPASASSPYSRSENPPPFPTRAPRAFTATAPHTMRSMGGSVLDADRAAEPLRAADRGRLESLLAQAGRVQLEEALEAPQPRHRHVDHLALPERHPADRELRRVGIDLDRPGLPPDAQTLEMERRPLGADEVRDPPAGAPGTGRRRGSPSRARRGREPRPSTASARRRPRRTRARLAATAPARTRKPASGRSGGAERRDRA